MKINILLEKKCGLAIGIVLAVQLAGESARAGLAIPYTPDAATMHLWHLNDASGQLYAVDSATLSPDATPITLENIGEPTPGSLPTNAFFGASGPNEPGLSTCYSGITKQHLLGGYNGSGYGAIFPNVSQFCNPATGAFSFEAVLNISSSNVLSSIDAEILTGDNSDGTSRGWQWRLENGALEWDLQGGSTDNDFKPLLPTTGNDAVSLKTNSWYHVAVTFTGQSPTNGDPASVITLYWTLLDPCRTNADVLAQYTNDPTAPYGIRPLNGAPEGSVTPALGIGGSARNTTSNPGNNEGLIGSILEVRVSEVCRKAYEMAFTNYNSANCSPTFVQEPPPSILVGYGQTLTISPVVSGAQPLTNRWFQNGSPLPSQTNTTLSMSGTTFAANGVYYLIVSNQYGATTSSIVQVTVGAIASGLFPTGIGTNGQVSAGDIPDPHYSMIQSEDPNFLGPNALIYEWNCPIQFSICSGGTFLSTNGSSTWLGLQGNQGGVANNSPSGNYTYRTTFVLDQAIPATVTLTGSAAFTGVITNILVNGVSTGNYLTQIVGQYVPSPFTVTNGFVAGLNTLDFCQDLSAATIAAICVNQISAVGQAIAPGLPVILQQPASQIVRDASLTGPGSSAQFSVAAVGCPPLTYQWWADGSPLIGATNSILDISNPSAGGQGTNYSVVIANASGSITSSPAATLTIVPTNQAPLAQSLNLAVFSGQTATIQISYLIDVLSSDPDHDLISYDYAATSSTNGAANSLYNVTQNGATLVYTPVAGYSGSDQFTYTVQDSLGATTAGNVNIVELANPAPLTTVLVGGTTNLSAGVAAVPAGYSFQWQHYGTNLPGAASAQLVISNAQTVNAGPYRLSVIDGQGNVTRSAIALVALNGAPMPIFNGDTNAWRFNGYGSATNMTGNVLTLTDGALSESRNVWYVWPQEITNFSASFIYKDVNKLGADGFAFVLQNSPAGAGALGAGGGDLGYTGVQNSVAFEFNIYAPYTVGIALRSGGLVMSPFTPTLPVNLASGDPIAVSITYAAGVAQLTLTDLTTTLSTNIVFDVATVLGDTFENIVGTNIAFVGFTGADGGVASTQTISNFVFMPTSLPLLVQQTAPNLVALSWTQPYSGFVLQSTTSLSAPWQNVTAPVTAVGGQYQVTVPVSAGVQFYRLILP